VSVRVIRLIYVRLWEQDFHKRIRVYVFLRGLNVSGKTKTQTGLAAIGRELNSVCVLPRQRLLSFRRQAAQFSLQFPTLAFMQAIYLPP
jgi:hypothetical protein